jgi:hypothetical protein
MWPTRSVIGGDDPYSFEIPRPAPAPALTVLPQTTAARQLRDRLRRAAQLKPPQTTRINPRTGNVEAVAGVDNDMQRTAELVAAGLLDPKIAANQRAIAAMERQEIARGMAFEGVAAALAKYTAGIPEGIRSAYQGAADRTAGYGGMMSGELGEAASGAAQQAGETIANIGVSGGPGVTSEGGALANTTNYLGGFLPASDLAAEAANRMAEASTLRMAGGARLAEEALASMRATRAEVEELRMQGLDLEHTRPAEIQKALTDLRQMSLAERQDAREERALQVQIGQLQLSTAKTAFEQAEAMTNLTGYVHVVKKGKVVRTKEIAGGSSAYVNAQEQINQNARTAATQAGQNARAAATRRQTAAQNRIANAKATAQLKLDERRTKIAEDAEARLKGQTVDGKPQFTAKQKQEYRGTVNAMIRATVAGKNPAGNRPRDVVSAAMSQGVPYSLIVSVMRSWARSNKRKDWLEALNAWQR